MLKDALLHILESVVVVVEHALGILQVQVVVRRHAPGQVHHRLQVVVLHIVVGRLLVHPLQLRHLLAEQLLYRCSPLLRIGLLEQTVHILLARFTQFLLYRMDLCAQILLALQAGEFHLRQLVHLVLHLVVGEALADDGGQLRAALFEAAEFQQLLMVMQRHRERRTQVVDEEVRVGDVVHGEHYLARDGVVGTFVDGLDVVADDAEQGLGSAAARLQHLVVEQRHLARKERLGREQFFKMEGTTALDDHRMRTVGEFKFLHNLADDTVVVQVVASRIINRILLAYYANVKLVLLRLLHHADALRPTYRQRHGQTGEHHHLAKRNQWESLGSAFLRNETQVEHIVAKHGHDGSMFDALVFKFFFKNRFFTHYLTCE